jgi:hypothetical protein
MAPGRKSESENSGKQRVGDSKAQGFRPSEFMRARRPELFSDSRVIQEPRLTKEVFEYHLDTLTSRKQETEFEHFCRRLAEKELCPNLRPQTGPTGGGDSKVDAETYPVADDIALRWYEGLGTTPSQERWAFAFSAKKDWRSKAQADVKGIAETDRGYKLIYFMTNQFAGDKARAQLEDRLSRKYGVPVRILDRSWITKCVLENNRIQLAVDALGLSSVDATAQKVIGPRDTEREAELTELEKQIEDTDRYQGVQYQLAQDCLRAALLARGLEYPRVEIEGRFARAERIAEKVGRAQQRLRIAYKWAWTAVWWFDDFDELNRLYDKVEELAAESNQATDLELLTNLWTVLSSGAVTGRLNHNTAKLEARTIRLRTAVESVASDGTRPNNALQARTSLLLMDLPYALGDPKRVDVILGELEVVITKAEGLVAYHLEPLVKIVKELGDWLTDNTQYDELLESVVDVMQRRVSEAEAGRILLERGSQKLRGGKPYDAIRLFGRAWQKLAVRECRGELIAALLGCGLAYESTGLLWAARASVLAAANQALSEFIEEGTIPPQALTCLRKLVWLELELGRVPCVLQWMAVASTVAQQLALTEDRKKSFVEEREAQDGIFGILFLKADLPALRALCFLPGLLEESGLYCSWMALLYALGYEDLLRSQSVIPESEGSDSVREFFGKWLGQPAADDLPNRPELLSGDRTTLRSRVLGCEVTVHADNSLASLFLGEQILGALEGLLATSLERRVFPHAQDFRISIDVSDAVKGLPEYKFDESRGGKTIDIKRAAKFGDQTAVQTGLKWLQDLVLQILPRIAIVDDLESYAQQVFGEEAALSRAFTFSDPSIPIKNIVGGTPRLRLADWEEKTNSERFPLRRESAWNHGLEQAADPDKPEAEPRFGEGEPPEGLFDFTRIKHRDVRVLSLINIPLWDKAGWRGVAYLIAGDLDAPPLMALVFSDSEAARGIFQEWRDTLGKVDKDDLLRVAVITGIHRENPHRYRVVIGSNRVFPRGGVRPTLIMHASRINQMDPQDSRNLDGFVMRFNRLGRFFFAPAYFPESARSPEVYYDLSIGKRMLHVRPAWQIGENDPDIVALEADDDPIIPRNVATAPVIRALERIRKKSSG